MLSTETWSGGDSNDNQWTSNDNWAGVGGAGAGDDLVFPSVASRLTNSNDFAVNTSFSSLAFNGNAYDISGNQIILTGGTVNNPSGGGSPPIFSPNLLLSASQTFNSLTSHVELIGVVNLQSFDLTLTGAGNHRFDSQVSGGVGSRVVKNGNGTARFFGNSANAPRMAINAGTAVIEAGAVYNNVVGINGGGSLIVLGTAGEVNLIGGTLRGDGTLGRITNSAVGSAIAPGNTGTTTGVLTSTGNVDLNLTVSGASLEIDLNGTTEGTQYDRLVSTGGNIHLSSDISISDLSVSLGFTPTVGQTFTIVETVGAGNFVIGQFAQGLSIVAEGQLFSITYNDTSVVLTAQGPALTIAKDFSNPGNDGAGDTPEEQATAGSSGKTFFIVVTNRGTSLVDNVVISDVVPAALTVTNVSGTRGAEVPPNGDNNVQWSLANLGAGQSVTLTVTYSVASNVNAQLVNNAASVISDEATTPVQNSDDVQIVENAPLTIANDFSNPGNDGTGDTPEETATTGGASQTFFITVTNTGVSTADNVHITDTVDNRLIVDSVTASPALGSDQDASAQGIDWLNSSLAAGQSVTLTVTYHVASGTNAALVSNTATADSDEVTPVNDTDDVQILEDVDLTIVKDFTNPPNDPTDTPEETATAGGASQTFFITVTNTGVSAADNLHITDTVDNRLIVDSVAASPALGSDQDPSAQGIDWLIEPGCGSERDLNGDLPRGVGDERGVGEQHGDSRLG